MARHTWAAEGNPRLLRCLATYHDLDIGNEFSSEALEGALPERQNNPRVWEHVALASSAWAAVADGRCLLAWFHPFMDSQI